MSVLGVVVVLLLVLMVRLIVSAAVRRLVVASACLSWGQTRRMAVGRGRRVWLRRMVVRVREQRVLGVLMVRMARRGRQRVLGRWRRLLVGCVEWGQGMSVRGWWRVALAGRRERVVVRRLERLTGARLGECRRRVSGIGHLSSTMAATTEASVARRGWGREGRSK